MNYLGCLILTVGMTSALWAPCAAGQLGVSPSRRRDTDHQIVDKSNFESNRSLGKTTLCSVLTSAYAEARELEPAMRSFLLDKIAGGLKECDGRRARAALVGSFSATLAIADDQREIRQELQTSVLSDLLSLDEAKVQLLLLHADRRVQGDLGRKMIVRATIARKFDRALRVLDSAPSGADFPYEEATRLMIALPANREDAKQEIFIRSMASFHEGYNLCIGCDDFASMIVKFWKNLPADEVLAAIDEVLEVSDREEMPLSFGREVSFASEYDYRVVELLPVLRQLDDSEADRILSTSHGAQALLKLYPSGVLSATSPVNDVIPNKAEGPRAETTVPANEGEVLSRPSAEESDDSPRSRMAEEDPHYAIAAAAALPITAEGHDAAPGRSSMIFPRVQALLTIALVTMRKNPSATREALERVVESLANVDASRQVGFCEKGISIAEQIGETELAQRLFDEGMKYVEKMKTTDTDPEDPNKGLRAWWPSVTANWRLVHAISLTSEQTALSLAEEIPDPELRLALCVRLINQHFGIHEPSITMVRKTSWRDNWTAREND